jgi:hypothetical protein
VTNARTDKHMARDRKKRRKEARKQARNARKARQQGEQREVSDGPRVGLQQPDL